MVNEEKKGSPLNLLQSGPVKQIFNFTNLIWLCVFSIPVITFINLLNLHPYADGMIYVYMADGFANNGKFLMSHVTIVPFEAYSNELVYSHMYPPLYPAYLGFFYKIFGFSLNITRVAIFIEYMLMAAVLYFTSKDILKSKEKGLIVTALVCLNPYLMVYTARANTEAMLIIFFTLTVWGIYKAIDDERYMIPVSIFAGLGYLTKASMGYFFLLAGVFGFLWRFYFIRWKVFSDKYYMSAIGIFFAFVAAWAYRNILRFGWPNWETSKYVTEVVNNAVVNYYEFIPVVFVKLVFLTIIVFSLGIFFLPHIMPSRKIMKDEVISLYWLGIFLTVLLGSIFSAMFLLVERFPMFWADNIRYTIMGFIPMLWLGLTYFSFDKEDTRSTSAKDKKQDHKKAGDNKTPGKKNQKLIFVLVTLGVIGFLGYQGLEILAILYALGLFSVLFLKTPRKIMTVLLLATLVLATFAASITFSHSEELYEDLQDNLNDGDSISWAAEEYPPYDITMLPLEFKIDFISEFNETLNATYVVKNPYTNISMDNYTLIGQYSKDPHYKRGYINWLLQKVRGTPVSDEISYELYHRNQT